MDSSSGEGRIQVESAQEGAVTCQCCLPCIQIQSARRAKKEDGFVDIHIEPPERDSDTKKLFKNTMGGKWKEVVKMYKARPDVREAKITRAGDTALHIAISDTRTDIVEQLVDIVKNDHDRTKLVRMEDGRKNTPLHLAAAQGSEKMCLWMAELEPDLVKARNKDGETPLFLAVLHGKSRVFVDLHRIGVDKKIIENSESDISHCRRNDGNTILHMAIVGEYYDLAWDISQKLPALVHSYNAKGQSNLHLLAKRPSAFRSGCNFGLIDQLIYKCMIVFPLRFEPSTSLDQNSKYLSKVPENYKTFVGFLELLLKTIQILVVKVMPQIATHNKAQAENGTDARHRYGVSGVWRQCVTKFSITDVKNTDNADGGGGTQNKKNGLGPFPTNYATLLNFLELVFEILLVILGLGFLEINKIKEKKRKHAWVTQLMEELVRKSSEKEYDNTGQKPDPTNQSLVGISQPEVPAENVGTTSDNCPSINSQQNTENEKQNGKISEVAELLQTILNVPPKTEISPVLESDLKGVVKNAIFLKMKNTEPDEYKLIMDMGKENKEEEGKLETPILVAARMGVKEMVETILKVIPVAIQDANRDGKNVVLLAVENRQPHVYKFLRDEYKYKERVFQKLDNDDNSALHLAATLGKNRPWRIPGAALQLQWEIKWYKFVKESTPRHFYMRHNNKGQTPKEVFTETHKDLVKDGSTWLTNTAQSCSVVAALIATVAFATAATVPGGLLQDKGIPVFEGQPAFDLFAITSLIALCFSVTSLTIFLTILTSRYQEADFGNSLPLRLIVGLTSLFISITSMLISFCAGHFFVLKEELKYAAVPVYVVTCFPITIFAIAQFPLYLDLVRSTITSIPKRMYEMTSL